MPDSEPEKTSGPEESAAAAIRDAGLPGRERIIASALGAACIVTGAVATFVASNGAGSAALLAGGLGLVVLAFLGNRLTSFKFAGVEAQLEAATSLYRRAEDLDARGQVDEADQLRAQADRLLLQVAPDARAYEELRRTEPAGPQRTRRLYETVRKAEQFGREHTLNPDFVQYLFEKGEDGDRVFALVLMKKDPRTADGIMIAEAIEDPRSAFEQYQALMAAESALPRLLEERGEPLEFLYEALTQQTAPGGWINETTDRWSVALRLLDAINRPFASDGPADPHTVALTNVVTHAEKADDLHHELGRHPRVLHLTQTPARPQSARSPEPAQHNSAASLGKELIISE